MWLIFFCLYIISVGVVYGLIREETRDDEIFWVSFLWPLILFFSALIIVLSFLFITGIRIAELILKKRIGDIF